MENDKGLNTKSDPHFTVNKRIAYHLAVHSASIYLGNKQKQLPAVHFQIIVKLKEQDLQQSDLYRRIVGRYTAIIEGGRLIQNLPMSFSEATRFFSSDQLEAYRCAYEADVINLLAGPLAEVKYVALGDGEAFKSNLINLRGLHFYGGSSNIKVIEQYMACLIPHKPEREKKLAEIFLAAFSFVNEASSWQKISALAEYIRYQPIGIISCVVMGSLLDSDLPPLKNKAKRAKNKCDLLL